MASSVGDLDALMVIEGIQHPDNRAVTTEYTHMKWPGEGIGTDKTQ